MDGYAGCFHTAPDRPYCADDPKWGQKVRPLRSAVQRWLIQPNPPGLVHWLVFDVERADAASPWRDAGLLQPQLVMVNPSNQHAHAAWRLAGPVRTTEAARSAPISYAQAVQGGDAQGSRCRSGYTGLLVKNPAHLAWETHVADVAPYTLSELGHGLDLRRAANHPDEEALAGLKRNCTLFESGRHWAYGVISEYWSLGLYSRWLEAVKTHLKGRNGQFPEPLLDSELRSIARSIAQWTWQNISPSGRALHIERTHSPEKQEERGKRAGNWADAGRWSGQAGMAAMARLRQEAERLVMHGLSTLEIAAELDVNQSTVSRWLR